MPDTPLRRCWLPQFKNKPEAQAYVDAKYIGAWKVVVAKINAVEIELARVQKMFAANAPAGLPPDETRLLSRYEGKAKEVFASCEAALSKVKTHEDQVWKILQEFRQDPLKKN
jgi:hypothetical protein